MILLNVFLKVLFIVFFTTMALRVTYLTIVKADTLFLFIIGCILITCNICAILYMWVVNK